MFDNKVVGGLKRCPFGLLMLKQITNQFNHVICLCDELDCDWIWIGFSIHFEKWILILIDNH